ncbi:unnamed protein product [Cercopithifilaria johnstoni]|uniref:Uncharacterized protein n=1 Tax=Cercopithifilaria johnstoni TaxID=2874296 RepID=A0A8J2LYL7_9BILA|nr:unnamed protein product [Cercopithifilaria johnstoni]
MAVPVVVSKPKRYYLPLSLSVDDAEYRYKRLQYDIGYEILANLRYFDAELFAHSITSYPIVLMQQSLIKNQHGNFLSEKAISLSYSRLTSGCNRMKQEESIPKQTMPQQLSKHSRSLPLAPRNKEQMFKKCCHERSENIKFKKFSKIFPATKHISLLSTRHETDNNKINFVDTNYDRDHNTDSRIKSPTLRYSNRFSERCLKTTLVASAEKMKHAFRRNVKAIESPTMSKDHKCMQYPMNYFINENNDVSKLCFDLNKSKLHRIKKISEVFAE